MTDVLEVVVSSPLFIFLLAILLALILYLIGGKMAPKYEPRGGKASAYTGGEDLPGRKQKVAYEFYHLALIFTVLHVTAVVVATAFLGSAGIAAMVYLVIGATAMVVVLLEW